ncbi:MAG TPA: hypothetical protein VHT30_13520 [Acidimicrobiales bacterium]|nr:hypothetical protein [Acidimicrobiales bacterium]
MRFGSDGNLVSDADRNSNTLTFTYVGGRLVTTIVADAGASPSTTATIAYGGPGAGCRRSPKTRWAGAAAP